MKIKLIFIILGVAFLLFSQSNIRNKDTLRVKADSILFRQKQHSKIITLFNEQKSQIDSIKVILHDPLVVERLKKRLKK